MTARSRPGRHVAYVDLIGASVVVALSAIAFFAVVRPMIASRSQRAQLRLTVVEQQVLVERLEAASRLLGNQLSLVGHQLREGHVQLQPPHYLNARMATIVELASASGIVIHETRSGAVLKARQYQSVPIYLYGEGSYTHCAAFLHHLHERLPDAGVVGFELIGHPGKPRAPDSFRFDLVWFAAASIP